MKVYFWGTRGSLPALVSSDMIERKLLQVIQILKTSPPENDQTIKEFIHTRLPFIVRSTYGSNTSCVEIKGLKEYVLCDAGTGLRDFGQTYMKKKMTGKNDLPAVFHIFISHPHWDHIQGFPFFTPAFIPGHQVYIHGHHPDLEKAFIYQQEAPYFPVPLKAMRANISFHVMEPGKSYDIAGMSVTGIKQNHPGDSYGYCFTRAGKKIVYSTDAEHKQNAYDNQYEFIRFFSQADLLIFDAQYSLLDAIDTKENWGHSSNLVGVELSVRAGVKRLCLFHSEHTYDDESLERVLNDTRKYLKIFDKSSPLEIHVAYDGMELEI